MSRSGYCDDLEPLSLGRWRAQVASAIRGKRGQKLLSDLLNALDEMEQKELIADELIATDGAVCALGALGKKREYKMAGVDVNDADLVASMFDVAPQLAREIVSINDDGYYATPTERWGYVRQWVANQIKQTATA